MSAPLLIKELFIRLEFLQLCLAKFEDGRDVGTNVEKGVGGPATPPLLGLHGKTMQSESLALLVMGTCSRDSPNTYSLPLPQRPWSFDHGRFSLASQPSPY